MPHLIFVMVVVGDGRRVVLGFQGGGEIIDVLVEAHLGLAAAWPPAEASHAIDGSAAASLSSDTSRTLACCALAWCELDRCALARLLAGWVTLTAP